MRHRRQRGKLGVKAKHRTALLRNLVRSLVMRRRIRTTFRKAKVASAFADKMVQLAKRGDLHARRLLIARLGCVQTANTLITQIAPHFKDRQGGYTRVLRMGTRVGDGGEVALLEFTAAVELPKKAKKPSKEKKGRVKAETVEAPEKPKKEKPKSKEKTSEAPSGGKTDASSREESVEKKESEKKGGFLGALRRFLKGDEESR